MKYYGLFAGSDLQRVARSADDSYGSGERVVKGGKWVADKDILTEAKFSGEWDPITAAEAEAFVKSRS